MYFFYFPLKIKNVREGILIIEYKNVIKKVNFKLGFEKYVVPNQITIIEQENKKEEFN